MRSIGRITPLHQPGPVMQSPGNGAGFPTNYILHDQSIALGWTDTISKEHGQYGTFWISAHVLAQRPDWRAGGAISSFLAARTGRAFRKLRGASASRHLKKADLQALADPTIVPSIKWHQTYQLLEALYWVKGLHSLQFGYEYHQDALNFFDIEAPQGIVYNSGIYTQHQRI